MNKSAKELRASAEEALASLGEILEELTHRSRATALFDQVRRRGPTAGRLAPPDATRTYSVYVIELKETVWNKSAFRSANPGRKSDMSCLYVGMTAHTPDHRFRQHAGGENDGRFVKEYGVRLRPDLYQAHNPLTRQEAVIEEKGLARELRAAGYAVWQK